MCSGSHKTYIFHFPPLQIIAKKIINRHRMLTHRYSINLILPHLVNSHFYTNHYSFLRIKFLCISDSNNYKQILIRQVYVSAHAINFKCYLESYLKTYIFCSKNLKYKLFPKLNNDYKQVIQLSVVYKMHVNRQIKMCLLYTQLV